jgi:hypothetical protein
MTSGAGAGSATGMIKKYVEMFRHIEERHGFSMVPIGQCAVFELNRAALGKKCDADHFVIHRFAITFFQ